MCGDNNKADTGAGKCCELDNDRSRLVIVTIQSAVGDTHADGEAQYFCREEKRIVYNDGTPAVPLEKWIAVVTTTGQKVELVNNVALLEIKDW